MPMGAHPRVAALKYCRHKDRGATLVAEITSGPRSELGRTVHIPLTRASLPMLQELVAKLREDV